MNFANNPFKGEMGMRIEETVTDYFMKIQYIME